MLNSEDLRHATLSGLGAMLLDAMDEGIANGEPMEVERACVEVGNEIILRVPDAKKLRHLMDFHYNKWANWIAKENVAHDEYVNDSYLELRAMMAGYVQCHYPCNTENQEK